MTLTPASERARLGPQQRDRNLARLATESFDVVVIGGGVVGAGCALDAAARGLDVALVEARDLGSGTSSRSTKLIHGGLRYLEQQEFGLVREALKERRLLLNVLAPHLVRPVSFLYPPRHRWERAYVGAGRTGAWTSSTPPRPEPTSTTSSSAPTWSSPRPSGTTTSRASLPGCGRCWKANPEEASQLSREHTVAVPIPGLVAVAGGKSTTYRVMAKDAVDAVVWGLDQSVAQSPTEHVPLLGAVGFQAMWNRRRQLAESSGLHLVRIEHLFGR
jgi:glycerol-3-phosphate dehydrogenase